MNNINELFINNNILLPVNIANTISFHLYNSIYLHNHISFIINKNNNKIIAYGFNYYLKSNKFPFSLHSEINTINKYYKKKLTKNIIKAKKILLIFKISKTGVIGNSKPCQNCANYILNNFENMNIYKIYYTMKNNILEELTKNNLKNDIFTISSGFKKKYRGQRE
jgi:tRNA(Arg) A34 adenosine deaminase TadA